MWQNINLKQKAVFEIIQRVHARELPYYLEGAELDFFVRGIAWGPHRNTYLPQLVERHKRHGLVLLSTLLAVTRGGREIYYTLHYTT